MQHNIQIVQDKNHNDSPYKKTGKYDQIWKKNKINSCQHLDDQDVTIIKDFKAVAVTTK